MSPLYPDITPSELPGIYERSLLGSDNCTCRFLTPGCDLIQRDRSNCVNVKGEPYSTPNDYYRKELRSATRDDIR